MTTTIVKTIAVFALVVAIIDFALEIDNKIESIRKRFHAHPLQLICSFLLSISAVFTSRTKVLGRLA